VDTAQGRGWEIMLMAQGPTRDPDRFVWIPDSTGVPRVCAPEGADEAEVAALQAAVTAHEPEVIAYLESLGDVKPDLADQQAVDQLGLAAQLGLGAEVREVEVVYPDGTSETITEAVVPPARWEAARMRADERRRERRAG
jgi:hypothetical protein